MKKVVRLTESQLNRIILNTAKRLIKEAYSFEEWISDNYASELDECAEEMRSIFGFGNKDYRTAILNYLVGVDDGGLTREERECIADFFPEKDSFEDMYSEEYPSEEDSKECPNGECESEEGNVWDNHGFRDEEDYWNFKGIF